MENKYAITKALNIQEPWISMILSGNKTWEMRSVSNRFAGFAGLIKTKTKTIVGIAQFHESLEPSETQNALAATEEQHRMTPGKQFEAWNEGWTHPWPLSNVQQLADPVPYKHTSQVRWVKLGEGEIFIFDMQLAV